jgi:hypothetical protein
MILKVVLMVAAMMVYRVADIIALVANVLRPASGSNACTSDPMPFSSAVMPFSPPGECNSLP